MCRQSKPDLNSQAKNISSNLAVRSCEWQKMRLEKLEKASARG